MLVEMKHFSHVIQVQDFSQSESNLEHFNLSFGTMLCQATTFQNVGLYETLFTCHTSGRFFPIVNLIMNIKICLLLEPCFLKLQPFKMLVQMKHFSHVIQVKDFSPE